MSELNLPPFYVGQKVVALKSSLPHVKKGQIYTVAFCIEPKCCLFRGWVIGVKETVGPEDRTQCGLCGGIIKHKGYFLRIGGVKYFAPVQENFQSISLDKVLEKETPLISVN